MHCAMKVPNRLCLYDSPIPTSSIIAIYFNPITKNCHGIEANMEIVGY